MPGFLGGGGGGGGGTGGEISFPKEFIDPVTKFRVSQPENLIDTDFEYGLQPTKWETVELINNTPSFFSKSGDTTIDGIISMTTNAGTREITVITALDHNLAAGIPINVTGTKSLTADGSFIIASIPNPTTFTYLCKSNQNETLSINDLYTSIITGEFFQGSQIGISDSEGILTDGSSTSILTVKTKSTHGFGLKTPLYLLNINSTISQDFQSANTATRSFDASNSATAQTFDGSNTLSTLNIDWSNSGVTTGEPSTITSVSTTENTITVSHSIQNFLNLEVGSPLYYDISTGSGYFSQNPRGVIFLKTNDGLGTSFSTFRVSATPDGPVIEITSSLAGFFQISDQSRTFAGNNVDSATQLNLSIIREESFEFEGANDESIGANGTCTVTSYSGSLINSSVTPEQETLDYYQGAMIRYSTTGSPASGLTNNTTYFIDSFFSTGPLTFAFTIKNLPTDSNPISVSGGTGTQTFKRIGVSPDKNIVHIKNSNYNEKDMVEYVYPNGGNFSTDFNRDYYFISTVFDSHNYRLEPSPESFISATGGNSISTVTFGDRLYTVHSFTVAGTYTFNVLDEGTFGQSLKYVVSNGSYDGFSSTTTVTQGSILATPGPKTVVVNSGGTVDVAYPQDGGNNDIPFASIRPIPLTASGGSISTTTINGFSYRVHTFTSVASNTFSITGLGNLGNQMEVIMWGAGGGGGGTASTGAAGGAGAYASSTLTAQVGNYVASVGGGGGGAANGCFTNSGRGAGGTGPSGAAGGVGWNPGSTGCSSPGGGGGAGSLFLLSGTILVAAGGGGGGGAREGGSAGSGGRGGGGGQNGELGAGGSVGITGNQAGTNGAGGGTAGGDQSGGGGGAGGFRGGSAGTPPGADQVMGCGGGGGSSLGQTVINGNRTTPGNSSDPLRGTSGNAGGATGAGTAGRIIVRYPLQNIT
jgi:hypothetical protein